MMVKLRQLADIICQSPTM